MNTSFSMDEVYEIQAIQHALPAVYETVRKACIDGVIPAAVTPSMDIFVRGGDVYDFLLKTYGNAAVKGQKAK